VCLGVTDADVETSCVCKNKNENDLFELHKANELCFKPKEVKKITLDNYVIRKNVKKSQPVVYPQQFTFNPRDPAFKHKGLKSKPQSRSQSVEKIRIADNVNVIIDDDLIKGTNIENRDNGENGENIENRKNRENRENVENNVNDSNEKRKKKKKKKKVSFDVTNYIDNI
jgi:hypothetical protein